MMNKTQLTETVDELEAKVLADLRMIQKRHSPIDARRVVTALMWKLNDASTDFTQTRGLPEMLVEGMDLGGGK